MTIPGLPRKWPPCRSLLLWVLLWAGVPANAEEGVLRVATYNVENYTSTGRMTPEGYRTDYPKPEQAKAALHRVLAELDADLLVLQEIGGEGHLEELRRDLAALGLDYPHTAVLEAADKERRLGALSRRPFARVVRHAGISFKADKAECVSKRGLLELALDTPDGPVTFWVLHLKSRITTDEADPEASRFRNAEATALRDRVIARHPVPSAERFLVLGDFNDHPRSRPLRAFQARGKLEISRLLEASDKNGLRWTHHHRSIDTYSRVDHVLCSAALLTSVLPPRPGAPPGAGIIDHPCAAQASDHRPLLVRLSLGAPKPGLPVEAAPSAGRSAAAPSSGGAAGPEGGAKDPAARDGRGPMQACTARR